MHMIAHDADLDDPRAVSLRFGQEERREEVGDFRVDERETAEGCPREVTVNTYGHERSMAADARSR